MSNPLFDQPDYQMANYRLTRSNALFFCKQSPAEVIHQSRPEDSVKCTSQNLKTAAEHWINEAINQWQKMSNCPQAFALVTAASQFCAQTLKASIIIATSADMTGKVRCYCPACMIDEMKQVENKSLQIEYPVLWALVQNDTATAEVTQ